MKKICLAMATVVIAAGSNPLANLPSAPGPTVALIQEMTDNSWLNLGAPMADSAWGTARGRSYSPRMVYCPDKQGIFLCATAIHGFVKPDGHYMDDLWFYDINAHQWICLYPGAGTPSSASPLNLHLDSNGLEVDGLGNSIPVSYLSHGYCNMAYNPDSSFYTIMWTDCPWWCLALPQRTNWLPGACDAGSGWPPAQIMAPKNVLYWDVDQGKWMRRFCAGMGPGGRWEGVVEYLPTTKKLFYMHYPNAWLYNYSTNTWNASNAGLPCPPHIDFQGCYDSKRDRVYAAWGADFWYYDVQQDRWDTVRATNQVDVGGADPYYASTHSHLHYDSANDVMVALVTLSTPGSTRGVYVYDYDANSWSKVDTIQYTKQDAEYDQFNSCYNPDLNAHFLFAAGDSRDNGIMLAYRYKKAGTGVAGRPDGAVLPRIDLKITPNPFYMEAGITATGIAPQGTAEITIFNSAGRLMKRMFSTGETLSRGIAWKPESGATGVLVVRVTAGKRRIETKGLFIK